MELKPIIMGKKSAKVPIIQGGMGVGISRGNLAGAMAHEGGIGVISCAQIGYDDEEFEKNPKQANIKALKEHIEIAKNQAAEGLVGVNIMTVTKAYEEYVLAACEAKADIIISGAGLPIKLPYLVKGYDIKIAPIVSSVKSASVILRMWDKKDKVTADMVIIEGPRAGGHLGFHHDQLEDIEGINFDDEIKSIIKVVKTFSEKYNKYIPVIVAGGIFDKADICHALQLGADGVQMGTRFVTTVECDASEEYKMAYIHAQQEEIGVVKSPVGMPGRAILNKFIENTKKGNIAVEKCYGCIQTCNPNETPYCITKALINAVKGNIEEALLFCGDNAYKCDKIITVKELIQELTA